jgi:predicted enzyme related to lactoylglutathione lyase
MEMTSYEPGTPSWVDLGTSDPAAAARYYGELFGWDVRDMGPDAGGYRMALLRGKPVAGIGPLQQPDAPPWWTSYVTVADTDTTAKVVRDAGGTVLLEPMDVMTAGRMAVFADPSQAVFAAWQPREHIGAGLVTEPGALCWNELATRQPDLVVPFYRAVFGWAADTQPMGPIAYTQWTLGGKPVGGMMPMDDENWPDDIPSHWMVYFAVEDTDATVAKASELGGTVSVPPTDIPPGRFAVLNDAQGAVFSVLKMAQLPPA